MRWMHAISLSILELCFCGLRLWCAVHQCAHVIGGTSKSVVHLSGIAVQCGDAPSKEIVPDRVREAITISDDCRVSLQHDEFQETRDTPSP